MLIGITMEEIKTSHLSLEVQFKLRGLFFEIDEMDERTAKLRLKEMLVLHYGYVQTSKEMLKDLLNSKL